MEEKTIEIRVRWKGDKRNWEDRHVLMTASVEDGAEEEFIRNNYVNPGVVEIRWNYEGSSQGHYIDMTKR